MVEILVLEYCRQTETVFKTRISRQAEARQTHGRGCAGRHARGFHDHRYCHIAAEGEHDCIRT